MKFIPADPLFFQNGSTNEKYFWRDNIHLNEQGYRLFESMISKHLQPSTLITPSVISSNRISFPTLPSTYSSVSMNVPSIVTVSHPVVHPHHVCPVPCNVNSDPHPVIHTCPNPGSVPLASHTVSSVTIPHPVKTPKLRSNKLKWEKCSYVHHPPVSVSSLNVYKCQF